MAIQSHVAMLHMGADSWNRWRKEKPDITPDLRGHRFESPNYVGFDFTAAYFNDCELLEATFTKCVFFRCRFERIRGEKTKWFQCELNELDGPRANFKDSLFSACQFKGSRLDHVIFISAQIEMCDFSGAHLS